MTIRFLLHAGAALLLAGIAAAQTPPEVLHQDDFDSYGTQFNPPGWVDTSVGSSKPEAKGLFKTGPDPLSAGNVVYGTKQASGKPEGNHPRIGTFSTFADKTFSGQGRFEYRGRLLRTNTDSRIGLTLFSSYPEQDRYYLVGLWSRPGATTMTMQLFAFGGGALVGTLDSGFTPQPDRWYRFAIQADAVDGKTNIRARFWPDGEEEPETFQIVATDASASRLTSGRIGVWAAVKGEAYVDDLQAKSPVDHTPPVIEFYESNDPIEDGEGFNRDITPEIRITDDLSTFTFTATLDGAAYAAGTPIPAEGTHVLAVTATDAVGNASSAQVSFFIDKTPPALQLLAAGEPVAEGRMFREDVVPETVVTDASPTTVIVSVDGATLPAGAAIAVEGSHTISATATDAVGWVTTAGPYSILLDKTPPVVEVTFEGEPIGAAYNRDVVPQISIDDLTATTTTATLDGAPYVFGTPVTTEGLQHVLAVSVTDALGWTTTLDPIRFTIDKTKPEVTVLANGLPFPAKRIFATDVSITLAISDTSGTTSTATLNGAAYTLGTPITAESATHSFSASVQDALGWTVQVGPIVFTIDKTPPVVTVTESGAPLADGAIFGRPITPLVSIEDLTETTSALTIDGSPFVSGTPVTAEGEHALAGSVTDEAGNETSIGTIGFIIDLTPPVVSILESGAPFVDGFWFNRDVVPQLAIEDVTATTVNATLNGAPFSVGSSVVEEGTWSFAATVTDAVGLATPVGPVELTIDKTPPAISFLEYQDGEVIGTPRIAAAGSADDAVTVTVNGAAAHIDLDKKTFLSNELALLEGSNTLVAEGTDRAGNVGSATITLVVDTRGPEIVVLSPPAGACVDSGALQVSGTISDPHVELVTVSVGASVVTAALDPATGAWSASIPDVPEGTTLVTIEATDAVGHLTSRSLTIVVDRSAPVLEIQEGGQPFSVAVVNRPVAFFVRAIDSDPNVALVVTLDGTSYATGASIEAEGAHVLVVKATDCAGHATEKTVQFTIDLTPPSIRDLVPAHATTVGTMPDSIRGIADADTAVVEIAGTPFRATPAVGGSFTIAAVPFAEGTNRFSLKATDHAGNSGSAAYEVRVRTEAPVVQIRESGVEIPANALFNRAVTPTVRAVDLEATVAATLNGSPFTSGTTISADGDYVLKATATDALGHVGTAEATFTIDRTPPVVRITSPAAGAAEGDSIEVRGTAGDAVAADVNGLAVTLAADGSFVVSAVPLTIGTNPIVATGRDAAGNVGRDQVDVTRDDFGAGVILTYPPDRSLTNRPATDVVGRLLTSGTGTTVTIGGDAVAVDPTGAFRISGWSLTEGENVITATATAANGAQTAASVRVTADFTPPALAILESGQPLVDGARFLTEAVISLETSDAGGGAVTSELRVDGVAVSGGASTITAPGGHALVATARDLAGNEARVERTLFIGAVGGAAGCALGGFDPADGSVVLRNSLELVGRTGGAVGVKVNGVAANVADGSFCATVELPAEGPNTVTIVCTDVDGNSTGTPATITLHRVTGDPSIAIDSPAEGFVSAEESIAVSGTVGAGVVSADVNGVPATISGSDTTVARPFTVSGVRLASGLNLLVAHGRNAAGRVATASRRGVLQGAPAINVSSPVAGATTGFPKITVAGTYVNVDSATLIVTNVATGTSSAATASRASDTTGTFAAIDVPLVTGEQTLRISGRDRLNREATATLVVTYVAGAPAIAIASPLDQAVFGPGSDSFTVSGTFQGAAGSTVEVNGSPTTVAGSSFTATATFSPLAGSGTPVVARVTEPSGASASALIAVIRLADAPAVVESFPAPNAVEVNGGALVLVLFSQPMDRASMGAAFRLDGDDGSVVTGALHLDRDVLTFAPATILAPGRRYTIRVTTAAKNLAGTALGSEYAAAFTVATTAPATAPQVDPVASAVCGESLTVTGTAAPGARVRLESGTLVLNAAGDSAGRFAFTYPISGQSGFALVRVRVVGSDGSVSPAAELKLRVDCSGPQVMSASYDRSTNQLSIHFSEAVDPASVLVGAGGSVLLTAASDGRSVGGTAAVNGNFAVVTPSEDLTAESFALSVTTDVRDLLGNRLVTPYSQEFPLGGGQPVAGDGSGFISGEVYDATTGRPLAGATISIAVPAAEPIVTATDARGRYLARLPEGAHTIVAGRDGYTRVWRQIVVPAGAGVLPIDIRLTRRGEPIVAGTAAISLAHGGDTAVTRRVELSIPAGGVISGTEVVLTSVGGQAITGLLPLGWSPLAAAEVLAGGDIAGAELTFHVPAADIAAAAQSIAAARYDAARDEWHVIASVVNVGSDGRATVPIATVGAYALVYADKAPGLAVPPLPVAGDVLRGVPAAASDAPPLAPRDFVLDPPVVLPTGRTVATLRIEAVDAATFPSGTAVQASIDEELQLADGSRLLDPPFAKDLLLYRNLAGDLGVANFHLAPSARAAEVILEVGYEHIRILPYPGRLDRGTLIGSEGGRVPADDKVAIEIPSGAVPEPVRATASALTSSDLSAIGSIPGFRIVGGFSLTLQRATEPAPQDLDEDGAPDDVAPVQLFAPARATFTVAAADLPSPDAQVVLAELVDQSSYGRIVRLAVPMTLVDPSESGAEAIRFTTSAIDRALLPVDGVAHEGRYLVLAAEAPIGFATGMVRLGAADGRLLEGARVTPPPLGLTDLSRVTGIYNVAVPSAPAGAFTLQPRHTSTGDGVPYVHPAAIDRGAVARVDLALVAQPPVLGSVVVLKGDPPSQGTLTAGGTTTDVALTTNVRASFSPAIDPASVTADSIVVTNVATGARVSGSAAADGTIAVVWTLTAGERLEPNARYTASIAGSIRGTSGAALGTSVGYAFTTVRQVFSDQVRRERIRITIPDETGVSRISGDPGALPAGWQAVAVRRGRDFAVRYQATAAGDGSFAFFIGNGGDPADRVGMGDRIDLQVISDVGNLAAIFALTPFVSEDGLTFVVPLGEAVRYTTPEGITLDVPAGTFDVPTAVELKAAKKDDFLSIAGFEAENEYAASVYVDFDGKAKKPMDVEIPVPAGIDTTGKNFILAWKGMSIRGPRLQVADIVSVVDGKFTTIPPEASASRTMSVIEADTGAQATLTGAQFRNYVKRLQGVGYYSVLDIRTPVNSSVGWAAIDGVGHNYDVMWDIFKSYYTPYEHFFEHTGAVIPVLTDTPFTVYGIDASTGLQAFSRTYDPLPAGPPYTAQPIPTPQENDGGPYPVFGSSFRVETLDLDVEDLDIETIRNFRVRLSNGQVQVSPSFTPLGSSTNVELLNVSKGTFMSGKATSTFQLSADPGDRIVLLIEQVDVDSRSPVSIVFNEPIFTGSDPAEDAVDAFLYQRVKVEQGHQPAGGGQPAFTDISDLVKFTMDSGNRRLNIEFPSALQSNAFYRVTLNSAITDVETTGPGLSLGQGTEISGGFVNPVGGGNDLHLQFRVRKPAGEIRSFTAADYGIIRGIELYGNTLFVAALDGGLRAFDVSNAAATGASDLLAQWPGLPELALQHLAVTVDRHGRVITTAHTPGLGLLRSYRAEDFRKGIDKPQAKANTIINWKLGYSSSLGLASNTVLSDRPESIPFRVKVVLQDDEKAFEDLQKFIAGTSASVVEEWPAEDLYQLSVSFDKASTYNFERITIENLTLDMRWSADASPDGPASFGQILARSTDRMRVVRNKRSYAIVAHLGFGVGVYDLNAAESNSYPGDGTKHREQIFLGNGIVEHYCKVQPDPYAIFDTYLNTDAEIRGDKDGNLVAYSINIPQGVLDFRFDPTQAVDECTVRSKNGLLFRTYPPGNASPKMEALRNAIEGAGGTANGRFMSSAQYTWSITAAENTVGARGFPAGEAGRRDYLLVAGFDYGLVVVEVDSSQGTAYFPLLDEDIADVVWVPGGVAGVRVIQNANLAVVNDKYGRVVLIDLSRIDEGWEKPGLFPTAIEAINGTSTDTYGVGSDDPRILWKSEPGVVAGAHPPVFDPVTGMVYGGTSTGRMIKVVSAVDPKVTFKANLGEAHGLSEVGGIVPLGIEPPEEIKQKIAALDCKPGPMQCANNASLGAFRIEVSLPGRMLESLTQSANELRLAVESERVAGAITEQTPDGFPRSHLRRSLRNGDPEKAGRIAANFTFRRIVPEELASDFRHQSGFNRFISPWIVAIADPRASREYQWLGALQKEEAGCYACDRPDHLKNLGESDGVYELFTNGRFITVRPELASSNQTIFDGTPYAYLGEEGRLLGRISTIMADTVRPTDALVPGQNAPVEVGLIQETLFLHSGELQSGTADLFAGGRAGSGVVVDRVYRSRALGSSPFGAGWDSSLFRRLRALPNGDVEYRDGADVWLYRLNPAAGQYVPPKGFFYNLARTASGWSLVDQQWRITNFDDLGRIRSESDEFFDLQNPEAGNVVRYVYDHTGRLAQVVDPVKRVTNIEYWSESDSGAGVYAGLVKGVEDWRGRRVDYEYDPASATLLKARLPEVANTSGGRPAVEYGYATSGSSFTDNLELRTNLASIRDPHEVLAGGPSRVKFTYHASSGFMRDRLVAQSWGTSESATFTYGSPTSATTSDALGQARTYALTDPSTDRYADRQHVLSMTETAVRTSAAPFGELPGSASPGAAPTTAADRGFSFEYDDQGQISTATLAGVRSTTFSYFDVRPEAPGFVLAGMNTTALGGSVPPVNAQLGYQSGANLSTFVRSVTANGQKIEAPQPSRNALNLSSSNDEISSTETFDAAGLPTSLTASGGTDPSSGGADTGITWASVAAPEHERGRPTSITQGGLSTSIQYPSPTRRIENHPRGVSVTTDYDSWDRPVHVTVTGPQMTLEESYEYDASGRLRRHVRSQGGANVTSTFDYDALGRRTTSTMNNVADAGTVSTSTTYNLPARSIVTTHPGGATTVVALDGLGRAATTETSTGGSPIYGQVAHDLAGNVVFNSDLLTASALAWDAHGRLVGVLDSDGKRTTASHDGFGMPTQIRRFDAAGGSLGDITSDFAPAGHLRSLTATLGNGQTLTTQLAWDGGGRTTGISVGGRAVRNTFDSAGRLLASAAGAGTATGIDMPFVSATVSGHSGRLPQKMTASEKGGGAYDLAREFNTVGDVITHRFGTLEWNRSFDQAGNLTAASQPGRGAATFTVDSRGAVVQETLPGGATQTYSYDPSGAVSSFTDPSDEITATTNDLIGRPTTRTYKDGTTESIVWEGRRVKSITDRQGRTQEFTYDAKGQIKQISTTGGATKMASALANASAPIIETIEYDAAGRITRWKTPDSAIEFSEFDFEGRPGKTVQERYRDGSLVDRYEQEHAYNIHAERSSWTMPTYPGFASTAPWTVSVTQQHDDAGNLTRIDRTLAGGGASTFVEAEFRGIGRPHRRTVTSPEDEQIVRTYDYDPATGLPSRLEVLAGGTLVAGSAVTYDGVQKETAQLLGVSGGARFNHWTYDERGRLVSSVLGGDASRTPARATLTAGDFRTALARVPETPVDPPSLLFTEDAGGGHKIGFLDRGGVVEQFTFDGAERIEDGRFHYAYDVKGRLAAVTGKVPAGSLAPPRRVLYFYDGRDRIIGRRAEYAAVDPGVVPGPSDWRLEDRAAVLVGDGLPAEATFVWDPIDDRLVAIYKAGASQNSSIDANGGLVRQFLHGDDGYDDPLEVAVASADGSGVSRLYPIYDEVGAGSLEVIVNESGRIVSRSAAGGAYGEDQAVLGGAAVDRVVVEANKDAAGEIVAVAVKIRSTETFASATVPAGLRLSVVDAIGTVVRTHEADATLFGGATAGWTLTPSEWSALVDPAPVVVGEVELTPAAVSFAVTSTARAQAWSATLPFLDAPAWAVASKPVYTSDDLPVEVRESLANLSQWLASMEPEAEDRKVLYDVPTLGALGTPRVFGGGYTPEQPSAETLLAAGSFHAHPFQDPLTGGNYVRARWYDPRTGTFLTPDPRGYRDSSNLYAAFANDPVNRRDPTGEQSATITGGLIGGAFGGGWAIGSLINDCVIAGDCQSAGHYLSQVAMFTISGAEMGAAIDLAAVGGGFASAALVGAGFEGFLTAASGDWSEFGGAQGKGAATGAITFGLFKGVARVPGVAALGQRIAGSPFGQAVAQRLSHFVGKAANATGAGYVVSEVRRLSGRFAFRSSAAASGPTGRTAAVQATARVYNARTSAAQVQSVLRGIDPTRLNPATRFGRAVYFSELRGTAATEVAAHGGTASHLIRYDLNLGAARILDFTNPAIAARWGYAATTSTSNYAASQAIAGRAAAAGYNVIKFSSVRAPGANYAVLSDFDAVLTPRWSFPLP